MRRTFCFIRSIGLKVAFLRLTFVSLIAAVAEMFSIAAIIGLGLQIFLNDTTSGSLTYINFLPDLRIEDALLLIAFMILSRTALLTYHRFLLAQIQAQSEKNIRDQTLNLIGSLRREQFLSLGLSEIQNCTLTLPQMIVARGIMPLNSLISDMALSLCAAGLIIYVSDWTTAAILFLSVVALATWSKLTIKGFRERGLAVLKYNKLLLNQMEHFSDGFLEYLGYRKVDRLITSTRNTAHYLARTQQTDAFLSGIPKIVFEFIALAAILIVLAMNEKLFENKEQAVLTISTIGVLLIRLTPILGRFGVFLGQIQSTGPLIADYHRIFNLTENSVDLTSIYPTFDGTKLLIPEVRIYSESQITAHRVGYAVERGRLLLIKGRSGSGKTSLIAEIVIAVSASHKLAVSPQFPTIIDGTVEANLEYFVENEGLDNHLTKLVKTSAVYCDLLKEFPERENSTLRLSGTNISGGQIKRLSVVRCLLSQHAIQVFDEPDSGLNGDATSKLLDLIRLLKKHFIFVVISHSKNFDELADEIIDFDEIVSLDRVAE